MILVGTERYETLKRAYLDGRTQTRAARDADVCEMTAVKYFRHFRLMGLPRGKVVRKRYARAIDTPPRYTGPTWIGKAIGS